MSLCFVLYRHHCAHIILLLLLLLFSFNHPLKPKPTNIITTTHISLHQKEKKN
ncbi:hypothetical protein GLYMA_19G013851v4 [Glycine max]|nr:hypothetical protein GLYMA_19G013851v4 [Glycine max]KAH1075938.1 hypothetical protein GYH30_051704 [Glycine max]